MGKLVHQSTRRVEPGHVIAIKPDGIHSVEAANGVPSCDIHVYLAALTSIKRSLFDWDSGEVIPFTEANFEVMQRVSG